MAFHKEARLIELNNVTVYYRDGQQALDSVSMHVSNGETMVLLGGSGAGKSTIFKAILKLLPIAEGSIFIESKDIQSFEAIALRRSIGTVFQSAALFPHLTVAQNIGLPLRSLGRAKTAIRSRVETLLHLLKLEPKYYIDRLPNQLSGGEQQRVGVARALAAEPRLLLMDEPFGALDAITRRHLQEELKQLRKALGITILFVTHDVMEAVSLGDRISVLHKGSICQTGNARELMEHPANDVVKALVSVPLMELETFVKDSVQ